jgi:hypothetical protein
MAMQRFQMMIDAELDAALEERAREQRISKAELIRRMIREQLRPTLPPIEEDPLWDLVGVIDDPDDGEPWDIDEIVYGPRDSSTPRSGSRSSA